MLHKQKYMVGLCLIGGVFLSLSTYTQTIYAQTLSRDTVVAEVEKDTIIEGEVIDRYRTLPAQVRKNNEYDAVRPQLIEQLTIERLFALEGRKNGLLKDKDVQTAVRRAENTILQQAFLQDYVKKNVSQADVEAEYNSYKANYSQGAEYRARHILVKTEDEGMDLVKKLDKGSDFSELAKTYSTGPSAPNGGDLGYFQEGQMVKPFENAVKLLDSGKYTKKPVKTDFGWHVIKLEDKRQAEVPELDELEEQFRKTIADRKLQIYVQELEKKYKIDVK